MLCQALMHTCCLYPRVMPTNTSRRVGSCNSPHEEVKERAPRLLLFSVSSTNHSESSLGLGKLPSLGVAAISAWTGGAAMPCEAYEHCCISHLQDMEICSATRVSCQTVPKPSVFLPSASQCLPLHNVIYKE